MTRGTTTFLLSWAFVAGLACSTAANGGDVDTSRDYEYTDWEALRRFAAAIVCQVNPEARRPSSPR